jgi:hypothetical protein
MKSSRETADTSLKEDLSIEITFDPPVKTRDTSFKRKHQHIAEEGNCFCLCGHGFETTIIIANLVGPKQLV